MTETRDRAARIEARKARRAEREATLADAQEAQDEAVTPLDDLCALLDTKVGQQILDCAAECEDDATIAVSSSAKNIRAATTMLRKKHDERVKQATREAGLASKAAREAEPDEPDQPT